MRLGDTAGDQVAIASGVQPGDVVVTEGSFFLRAERERQGLRQRPAASRNESSDPGRTQNVQTAKVVVNEQGFEPANVTLRSGTPARIAFLRMTDKTCATEVVFPTLDIKRALPLNEPVVIEFTPAKTGEIAFACGMKMLRGTIVVQ